MDAEINQGTDYRTVGALKHQGANVLINHHRLTFVDNGREWVSGYSRNRHIRWLKVSNGFFNSAKNVAFKGLHVLRIDAAGEQAWPP